LLSKRVFFFLIGNQRTIINEKQEIVQVVHDNEQQEKDCKREFSERKEYRNSPEIS